MTGTLQGVVKQWDRHKGYGFIRSKQVPKRVFCHITACQFHGHPKVGEAVTFTLTTDDQGRYRADDVRRVGQQSGSALSWRVMLVLCYVIVLGALLVMRRIDVWVPALVLGLSLISYLVYWQDKRAAQRDQWRTREKSLHLLALFGGWPGALFAQGRLRHKSRKLSFQVAFWISVVLNCLLIAGLATNHGQQWLTQTWKLLEPLFS